MACKGSRGTPSAVVTIALALIGATFLLAIGHASAQQVPTIRMGTHVAVYQYTFFLKKPELAKNYNKSYKVEWTVFAGGGAAFPALAANKVDASLLTPHPFANAILKARLDLKIVHQLLSFGTEGHHGDTWVVRADSPIRKVEDLKGKIIGVNAIGGTIDVATRIMLRRAGLDPEKDATIVEARPPHLPAMLLDKKIDVAALFQPFYEMAVEKGGIRTLFDSTDVFGGPQDYVFQVFRTEFLKEHPQAVRDYVEDYLAITRWMFANRDEAARIYAEQWKMPVPLVQRFFLTKKDYYIRPDGRVDPAAVQIVVDTLAKYNVIPERLDVAKYVDMSYLPR